MSGSFTGSVPNFGSSGAPGFISPFDQNAFNQGLGNSLAAMTNRYQQLGLGQTAASPSGPNQPFKGVGGAQGSGSLQGWTPGSGTTPTTPGSFGAGSTAYQQDVGAKPSLVGGLPAEFEAGLGQQQTADLGATASSAASALQGKNQQTGLLGSGLGAIGSILPAL